MRLMVVGGAGFLGSHLVDRLLAEQHVVDVVDDLSSGSLANLADARALGGDLKLHGTMDLITREVKEEVKLAVSLGKPLEPGDTEEVIRDLKSGESTPKANTARDSQQLTFYGLLRKAETGTSPGRYVLDHVVRKPGGTTQHIEQVTTRNDADVAALVQRIGAAVDAVQAGTFLPAAPTAWWCSSNWCEYFRSCRFVNPKEQ